MIWPLDYSYDFQSLERRQRKCSWCDPVTDCIALISLPGLPAAVRFGVCATHIHQQPWREQR